MADIEFKIGDETVKRLMGENMQSAISGAIIQQLGPEGRDELMKTALAALLVPQKRYESDRAKTPIERMFEDAYTEVAKKLVKEEMERQDSRMRAEVGKVLAEVMNRVFLSVEKREKLIEGMAERFTEFLNREVRGY